VSNVTLTIGGRPYTVSAPNGEESHIEMLGRMVAERAGRGSGPGVSETRMLLFAALMLADELHELHRQMPAPGEEPPAEAAPPAAEVIARIETLAERVEKLAARLEEPAT
jgi:cell division protein ZapA